MGRDASIRARGRTVLVVAFYFPPSTVAGTFRTLRFVRYLPDFGWTARVITTWPKGSRRVDADLLREVPPDVSVIRVPHVNTRPGNRASPTFRSPSASRASMRRFFGELLRTPDIDAGWLPLALPVVLREALRPEVRLIYTTGPPFGTHLLGLAARTVTGKPWLADFRDPWTMNPASTPHTPMLASLAARLERMVARSADCLIAVTEPLARHLQSLGPRAAPVVIPNGYDPAHFEGVSASPADTFTITYAGSLYSIHEPAAFLRGVRRFLDSNGQASQRIRVLFVGSGFQQYENLVRELELGDTVRSTGPLPHGDVLRRLVSSHVLVEFLTGDECVNCCVPCKLYEYLAARRPILMLARPGPAADLVRASGVGEVVPPDDPAEIGRALQRMHARYGTWHAVSPDAELLRRYEGQSLAASLARALDCLAQGRRP